MKLGILNLKTLKEIIESLKEEFKIKTGARSDIYSLFYLDSELESSIVSEKEISKKQNKTKVSRGVKVSDIYEISTTEIAVVFYFRYNYTSISTVFKILGNRKSFRESFRKINGRELNFKDETSNLNLAWLERKIKKEEKAKEEKEIKKEEEIDNLYLENKKSFEKSFQGFIRRMKEKELFILEEDYRIKRGKVTTFLRVVTYDKFKKMFRIKYKEGIEEGIEEGNCIRQNNTGVPYQDIARHKHYSSFLCESIMSALSTIEYFERKEEIKEDDFFKKVFLNYISF